MIDQLQTTRGDQSLRDLGTIVLRSRTGDDLTHAVNIRLMGATQAGSDHFLVFSVESKAGFNTDRVVISDPSNSAIDVDLSEDGMAKSQVQYFSVRTSWDLAASAGWTLTYNINATNPRTPRKRSTWVYTKAQGTGTRPRRRMLDLRRIRETMRRWVGR
jgi:hypothetical protein